MAGWRRSAVVTRVARAEQAAYGAAEALRLAEIEELAQEAVSALGQPRIAALRRSTGGAAVQVVGARPKSAQTPTWSDRAWASASRLGQVPIGLACVRSGVCAM